MDAFFHSVWAARIIFIFAITNIVLGLLLFFTCRCLPGWSVARSLMRHQAYLKFYKLHCYIWLLFLISVFVHGIFAIALMGVPF
jgi:hypothetical protein